ncbi:MAG: ROK family protein [Adhaeribacter sp.]
MELLSCEETYVNGLNTLERKKFLQKLKVIRHLYTKGAASNADLCEHFHFSSPTSLALLNELMAEGYVEKQGRGHSLGGRKPELYGLQDNSLFVLGIEMDRYATRMAIFNSANQPVTAITSFPIRIGAGLEAVEELHAAYRELIGKAGIRPDKLLGVGICMPGLIGAREGRNYSYLLSPEESLQQLLVNKFRKPVFIQNDVKAATLAEYRFGLAQSRQDVLVISMDWGIGIGMMMDGKLRAGSTGFAGEFGHIPLVEDGVLCYCGKRGCLETVASGIALVRLAKEGLAAGQVSSLQALASREEALIQPQAIIEAAHAGDKYAIDLLTQVGLALGKGIAMLIQVLNPELIILGGKMAGARHYITLPIQRAINTYCMPQLGDKTTIALSDLGAQAGIFGAVATLMENIFSNYIKLTR